MKKYRYEIIKPIEWEPDISFEVLTDALNYIQKLKDDPENYAIRIVPK